MALGRQTFTMNCLRGSCMGQCRQRSLLGLSIMQTLWQTHAPSIHHIIPNLLSRSSMIFGSEGEGHVGGVDAAAPGEVDVLAWLRFLVVLHFLVFVVVVLVVKGVALAIIFLIHPLVLKLLLAALLFQHLLFATLLLGHLGYHPVENLLDRDLPFFSQFKKLLVLYNFEQSVCHLPTVTCILGALLVLTTRDAEHLALAFPERSFASIQNGPRMAGVHHEQTECLRVKVFAHDLGNLVISQVLNFLGLLVDKAESLVHAALLVPILIGHLVAVARVLENEVVSWLALTADIGHNLGDVFMTGEERGGTVIVDALNFCDASLFRNFLDSESILDATRECII